MSSRFWSGVLPKPIPGIEADVILGDSRCHRGRESFLEERGHLSDDVVVPRLGLHRARLSLHVHEANVCSRVGDRTSESRIGSQRGDVVHERCPELERPSSDLGLRRIDGEGDARELLQHGYDAAKLLVQRDTVGAGPRGLAADVDESRSLRQEPARRRHRGARSDVLSPVRKAVRRDVDDPHHGRALPTLR